MEGLMICIFIIIVLACAIAVFYATIYNKFQEYIIRINEVESMIDTYLRNKYDLINKSIPIIKGNIKSEKEIFGEIVKLRSRKIGNFELYRILTRASNELNELRTEYNDIDNSNEIKKITKQIDDIDIKLLLEGKIKYKEPGYYSNVYDFDINLLKKYQDEYAKIHYDFDSQNKKIISNNKQIEKYSEKSIQDLLNISGVIEYLSKIKDSKASCYYY